MTDLANHPGAFLSEDAAPSLLRMEQAHGAPFHGSSFGRTKAEQQGLIDDWNEGGKYNRPPFLYKPYMPAEEGPHVVRGGEAFDCIDPAERDWIDANGREYGWYRNIPDGDPVHVIYVRALDQHRDDAPAPAAAVHTGGKKTMQLINVTNFNGGPSSAKVLIEEGKPDQVVNDDVASIIGVHFTAQDTTKLDSLPYDQYAAVKATRGA